MFYGCSNLLSLDLPDLTGVRYGIYEKGMYDGCSSLERISTDAYDQLYTDESFPSNASQWYSLNEGRWISRTEILKNRSGIADTYTSYDASSRTPIGNASVTLPQNQFAYAARAIRPIPSLVLDEGNLRCGIDYKCSYKNNLNTGTATITVSGIGRYDGSTTTAFEIVKSPLVVRARDCSVTYGDEPVYGGYVVEGLAGRDGEDVLSGTASISSTFKPESGVGEYPVSVSGLTSDNYDISFENGSLSVLPREVSLEWSGSSFVYDGEEHCPTVVASGTVYGDELGVSVTGAAAEAGPHVATATALTSSNYSLPDDVAFEFEIAKAPIATTVSIAGWPFGEEPSIPSVSGNTGAGAVTYCYYPAGETAESGSAEPPVDVGSYVVRAVVEETQNYLGGIAEESFEVTPADVSRASLSLPVSSYYYDGTPKTPAVEVILSGKPLVADVDYAVSYRDNVNPGTATVTVAGTGNYAGMKSATFQIVRHSPTPGPGPTPSPSPTPERAEMYRLYNPYTGEHFYTASPYERDSLSGIGWNYEGVGWVAPRQSNTSVYRLYNPYAGDHHYTTSAGERDALKAVGWNDEGVGWYSDDARGVPLYRQYNPYATVGTHNYTASKVENDMLVSVGWNAEGIGWYGMK